MKRGQITIFIIVGIMILAALGFLIYATSKLRLLDPDIEVNKGDDGCFRLVAEHVLLSAAAGGDEPPIFIQKPWVELPDEVVNDRALTAREYQVLKDGDRLVLGINKFPPLCLRNGPNRPNASGDGWTPCMSGTYEMFYQSPQETIQRQLQDAIDAQLEVANCAARGPSTVVFGVDDVVISTRNATTVIPIRFKRLHNAAIRVAQEEVKGMFSYDLNIPAGIQACDEPFFGNECLLPGFKVSVEHGSNHHVVVVSDQAQLIKGAPPQYRFLIESRYPSVTEYPRDLNDHSHLPIDLFYSYGGTSLINVRAQDPDDEPLEGSCGFWANSNLVRTSTLMAGDSPVGDLECLTAGITVRWNDVCPSESHLAFTDLRDIYYEVCDGTLQCANVTLPFVRVALSTDADTVSHCCSVGGATPDYCLQP
jgi:hypothetical protein